MLGAALASGDFRNVARAVVSGVDVAVFVDCYPVWVCTGSPENCGCAVWCDFGNGIRAVVGGVDVAGVVDCYTSWP